MNSTSQTIANMNGLPVEVAHLIMDHLEINDLCRLSSVDKLSFQRVSEYYHHNFSVRRILLPFFPRDEDFALFRELQRTHGVLVSGSQALSLFTRRSYQNSDLDLYVQQWQRLDLIAILERVGYTRHGSLRPQTLRASVIRWQQLRDGDTMTFFDDKTHVLARSEYSDKSIADVEEFRNGLGAVVQVITSYGPPFDVILGFHSSCVMNVVAYDYGYCLYPKATLVNRVNIAHIGDDDNAIRAQNKYSKRGYRLLYRNTSTSQMDFRDRPRFAGDRQCWTLPLVKPSTVPSGPINDKGLRYDELCGHSWTLVFGPEEGDGFFMVYGWLKFPRFEHMLCICSKVMWSLTPGMVTWTTDKFKEFVPRLFHAT